MHFLRAAQALSAPAPAKELSPSFWDAEVGAPDAPRGFDGVRPGIDAALARLLYTSGQVGAAVRLYLSHIRPSAQQARTLLPDGADASVAVSRQHDQVMLDDFEVAFKVTRDVSACVMECS
jgi:hypothetical protein